MRSAAAAILWRASSMAARVIDMGRPTMPCGKPRVKALSAAAADLELRLVAEVGKDRNVDEIAKQKDRRGDELLGPAIGQT